MKILLISYYFPPADFGATNRLLRILPFLAEKGLHFCALTVNGHDTRMDADDTLSSQIVGCDQIVRTKSFEPFRSWDAYRKREIDLNKQAVQNHISVGQQAKQFAIQGLKPLAGLARRILAMPDVTSGWYPFAVSSAIQLCKEQDFDLIFSTAPGQTGHLVARTVSSKFNLPWVADFRDDWFDYGRHYNSLEYRLSKIMLKRVVDRSTALTFTSLATCENYQKLFPKACKKMWFVPHGIVDLPQGAVLQEHKGEVWLGYIGTLDRLRDPSPLIQALELILVQQPGNYEKLHIKFVGSISPDMERLLKTSRVADRFDLVGFVTREESISWMKSCNGLLLILSDLPGIGYGASASKVYDYLAVRKPVLAIVPDGNISMLIERTHSGNVYHPHQIHQIASYLNELACGQIKAIPDQVALDDLRAEKSAQKLWTIFQSARQVQLHSVS